ncbi:hypothetical protein ACOJBM_41305 [Rhizobium beringeri]
MLQDPDYAASYEAFSAEFNAEAWKDDERILNARLLPDPSKARSRVYATQSTHKSLTALRRATMTLVWDEEFEQKTEENFNDALMTHTSTSPNYQLLASLDVARRQVEMEGYGLVKRMRELAVGLPEQLSCDPLLKKYFRVIGVDGFVPREYRESNAESYFDEKTGWSNFETAWRMDEFVLDPTHLTLEISATGLSGNAFKDKLMNEHEIQINKTTRNTALFIVNIGSTRSQIAHLIGALKKSLAKQTKKCAIFPQASRSSRSYLADAGAAATAELSAFHPAFRAMDSAISLGTTDGDIRSARSLSVTLQTVNISPSTSRRRHRGGRKLVSARSLVTPLPSGSAILV